MAVIKLVLLLFLITELRAWPVGKDIDIYDYSNSLDGYGNEEERIDLSYLGPEAYGTPRNESGNNLLLWSESSPINPEEMGEYAEGDILMPPRFARNGVSEASLKWPNGIIPYLIDGYFSKEQRDMIMKAIADYHRLTCLRFVAYSGQKDYIVIQNKNSGCWSSVGKIGGRQEVNLQAPGCLTKKGTVLHELLHAIGFLHEQSRPERDDFVIIRYENIKPGTESNFKKADPKSTDGHGVPYDYNSVMHYSPYAFSRNNQKTIEPKYGGAQLGQREGLSRGDVKKVNNMYKCRKEKGRKKLGEGKADRVNVKYLTSSKVVVKLSLKGKDPWVVHLRSHGGGTPRTVTCRQPYSDPREQGWFGGFGGFFQNFFGNPRRFYDYYYF